jgi:tetratricopeptide (TPR) repeat protein
VLEGARDAALRSVGPDHFVSLQALNNLATLCFREGRKDEAEAILMEVVASDRRAPPLDPRPNLMALKNLAKLCYEQVRFPEATAWADELVARTPSYDLDYTDRCQLRDKIAAAASGAPVLSPK